MQELTFLVADFKPFAQIDFAKVQHALPSMPHLDLALSRAQRSDFAYPGYESILANLLGLNSSADSLEFPAAAYTHLFDSGEAQGAWYMRADPVHLHPDRDRVVMVSAKLENITMADAQAIAQDINQLYRDEPWQLVAPHPLRWYLRLDDDPGIETASIGQVIGQNIDGYLPVGLKQKYWRAIFNEIQMLLHSHSVNSQRNNQNLKSINSVWFWGAGKLPVNNIHPENNKGNVCDYVWCRDALARGIAQYHNIPCSGFQPDSENWIDSCKEINRKKTNGKHIKHALVVMDEAMHDGHSDLHEWLHWLAHWQNTWLKSLLLALKSGQIEKLNLHLCNGFVYSLNKSDLNKWWWRKRPWYLFTQ